MGLFVNGLEIVFILLIFGFFMILPIIALVDIVRHDFTGNNKLVWVLVVLFLNAVGSVLYFALGKNQRLKKSTRD